MKKIFNRIHQEVNSTIQGATTWSDRFGPPAPGPSPYGYPAAAPGFGSPTPAAASTCPRQQPQAGHNDWIGLADPRFAGFNMCLTCYNTVLRPTPLATAFVTKAPGSVPPNVAVRCDMSRYWVRVAGMVLLTMNQTGQHDVTLLARIAGFRPQDGDCPNATVLHAQQPLPVARRVWYTLQDPTNGCQPLSGWMVCSSCVVGIQTCCPAIAAGFAPVLPQGARDASCGLVPSERYDDPRTAAILQQITACANQAAVTRRVDMAQLLNWLLANPPLPRAAAAAYPGSPTPGGPAHGSPAPTPGPPTYPNSPAPGGQAPTPVAASYPGGPAPGGQAPTPGSYPGGQVPTPGSYPGSPPPGGQPPTPGSYPGSPAPGVPSYPTGPAPGGSYPGGPAPTPGFPVAAAAAAAPAAQGGVVCPRNTPSTALCYTMQGLPEFAVCEKCYGEVIKPHADRGVELARRFGEKPSHAPSGFTCQLYSDRMRRDVWGVAVSTGGIEVLQQKVTERRTKERELQSKKTQLQQQATQLRQQAAAKEHAVIGSQYPLPGGVTGLGPTQQAEPNGEATMLKTQAAQVESQIALAEQEWRTHWE